MKTLQEICLEINDMTPSNAMYFGPQLIEEHIKYRANAFKLYDIYDKLEPYVTDKVKSFWKNKTENAVIEANGNLLLSCFIGVTVERTVAEVGIKGFADRWIKPSEYIEFATLINQAADANLIEFGIKVEPFEIPLAIISARRRIMLGFYCYTAKCLQQLRSYSNIFTNEGELPYLLRDIVFHEDGDFDYNTWRNKLWAQ